MIYQDYCLFQEWLTHVVVDGGGADLLILLHLLAPINEVVHRVNATSAHLGFAAGRVKIQKC